jgi:predicted kinase
MVGLPGSGKSTWIKENIFDQSIKILSTDDIIQEYADKYGMTYNECFEDCIGEATKKFFVSIKESVENNQSMVIDRTNLSKKSRKKILDMIPDSYIKVCVYVTCENDICHGYRLQNRPGKTIPEHIVKNMAKSFEIPTIDEGFKSIVHIETSPHLEEEEIY